MATKTGRFGADSNWGNYTSTTNRPYDLNVDPPLEAQEYPIQIVMSGLDYNNGFYCSEDDEFWAQIWLTDPTGTNEVYLETIGGKGSIRDYKPGGKYIWDIPEADQKKFKGQHLCLVKKCNVKGIYYRGHDATITVTTQSDNYNVIINQTTGGTAGGGGSKSIGSTVTLTATPDEGWHFDHWTSSPAVEITNNQFTMPERDVTITPVWAKNAYSITGQANIPEAGTVTVQATGQIGDQISVSQTTNEGYSFDHWELNFDGEVSEGKFTMPAADVTVTAVYTRKRYIIQTEVEPAGAGSITAPATGQTGLTITLSQTPATGYTFKRWELSTGGEVTDNQFTMPAQGVTVKAVYIRSVHQITTVCKPKTGGVITCARASEYGKIITVSQQTNEGYIFAGWTLSFDGEVVDGKFTMPDQRVTVTANYTRDGATEPEADTLMEFDLGRIVPRFILQDRTGYAMAKAIEAGLKDFLVICQEGLDTWSDPDKMPEWRLDELAWEYGIPYDYDASEDIKRKWIREVYPLSRLYGTAEGIARYMDAYLQDAKLEENWEYGGDPFHFRMNFQGGWTPENIAWANKAIETVKNARSLLDGYHFRAEWKHILREGTAFHESVAMEMTIRKGNTAELDCYADENGDMLLDENGYPMLAE